MTGSSARAAPPRGGAGGGPGQPSGTAHVPVDQAGALVARRKEGRNRVQYTD